MLSSPVAFNAAFNTFQSRMTPEDYSLENVTLLNENIPRHRKSDIRTVDEQIILLRTPVIPNSRRHVVEMQPLTTQPALNVSSEWINQAEPDVINTTPHAHLAPGTRQLCEALGTICAEIDGQVIDVKWFTLLSCSRLDEAITRIAKVPKCWSEWMLSMSSVDAAQFGSLVCNVRTRSV